MRKALLFVVLCAWLPAVGAAREQAAHEHGAARLEIVWIEGELQLQLEGAAFNFIGFEHAPATAEEHAALARASALLADADALYPLPVAADCRAAPATLDLQLPKATNDADSMAYDHHHHSAADSRDPADTGDPAEPGHGHWRITHRLQCDSPVALDAMALSLFEHFIHLQRIDYQLLTASRQSGGRLQRAEGPARIELRP